MKIKNTLSGLTTLLILVSSNNFAYSQTCNEKQDEIKLISRYIQGGNYNTATYSFKHMSQDINVTRNNNEILFEAREDFEDYFDTNTVVDDTSYIFDLGKKSCKDIKSAYPEDRKLRPLVWLGYSDASPGNVKSANSKANVKVGHCYLAYNNDEDGRVVTLFHVKNHIKSQSVTLDEIEVLDVTNSSRR